MRARRTPRRHLRPARRMLLAVVVVVGTASGAPSSARPADSGGGKIVFVSDRANPPGAVELLAPGHAPRELSPDSYTDTSPVVAPARGHIAYWSYRSGAWQAYVARPNGSGERQLALGAAVKFAPGGSPSFSPDGRSLLVPLDQYRRPARLALVDVRTRRVRHIGPRTSGTPEWSPDGHLIAVGIGRDATRVIVIDTAGRRRFSAGAADTHYWSSRGLLAVASTGPADVVT
jgi:Tol biopolymer transport system component